MKLQILMAATALAMLAAQPGHAALGDRATAAEIVECVRGNVPEKVGIRHMTVATTGRDGAIQEISARVYAIREAGGDGRQQMRAMMKVDSPASLAGAAYLVRETDDFLRDAMFIYLPAVGRVRRISGQLSDASLLGTDISYYDFKQLTSAFGDLKPSLEGRAAIDGRAAYALKFKPLEGAESPYEGVRAWVDQQSCLIVKAEFTEDGDVSKVLSAPASAITAAGSRWYLSEIVMNDKQRGTQTRMTVDEVTLEESLSDSRFNPRSFYRLP